MFFIYIGVLIAAVSAFFHLRTKRRDAAQRYAVAFAQWKAEWSGNNVHKHETIHIVSTNIQVAEQSVISSHCLGSELVDHSQKMTVAAKATAEKKAVGQRA